MIAGHATLIGGAELLEGTASDSTISRDRCESVPHTVEALYDEVRRFLDPSAVPTVIEYDQYGAPKTIRSAESVIDGGALVATLTP